MRCILETLLSPVPNSSCQNELGSGFEVSCHDEFGMRLTVKFEVVLYHHDRAEGWC